jgi:polyhydroxybutyrate depolymerase
MKKILSALLISLIVSANAFAAFEDIEYSWYRESIETLRDEGIISGYSETEFGDENTLTRAEILKMLFKMSGRWTDVDGVNPCFRDVKVDDWYHPFICAAVAWNLIKGYDDDTFKPNNPVTTLEAIILANRFFGTMNTATTSSWLLNVSDKDMQTFTNDNNITPTSSYNLDTKLSRWRATEILLRMRLYSVQKQKLNYKSMGCSVTTSKLSSVNNMQIGGKTREYLLSLPTNYTAWKEYGLVVAIHGRTNSNEMVQWYMGLGSRGGDGGWRRGGGSTWQSDFIVVYPEGLPSGSARSWSDYENVTFFDAMIREVANNHCIDRSQVYLVWHSLGAWFSNKLSCLRADVTRWVAAVAWGGYDGSCAGPDATLLYQNINDQLSSYASAKWAEAIHKKWNGCTDITENVTVGPLTCKKYSCQWENPVVWCEWYSGYGWDPHSWPTGGGTDILNFFRGLKK